MSSAAVQWIVRCYAAILVVAGVASYALGTSHAPIALVGGVGGGALLVVLSGLFRRRVFWSRPALVTAVGIFTLSFIWRSAESFMRGAAAYWAAACCVGCCFAAGVCCSSSCMEPMSSLLLHGTTVVAVIRDGRACIGSDGQVSLEATVLKSTARKVRRLYNDSVLAGFAGATADAFTLLERFEEQLGAHRGNLVRSAVELAKAWRTDRYLRRLEAMLVAATRTEMVLISGNGRCHRPR